MESRDGQILRVARRGISSIWWQRQRQQRRIWSIGSGGGESASLIGCRYQHGMEDRPFPNRGHTLMIYHPISESPSSSTILTSTGQRMEKVLLFLDRHRIRQVDDLLLLSPLLVPRNDDPNFAARSLTKTSRMSPSFFEPPHLR